MIHDFIQLINTDTVIDSKEKPLQRSSDDLVDTFRNVSDIVRVEARHGDAAIARKVDMRLVSEREGLFRVQTSEAVRRANISKRPRRLERWLEKGGHATNLNIPICLTM